MTVVDCVLLTVSVAAFGYLAAALLEPAILRHAAIQAFVKLNPGR
jgi:hypothetical protein